MEALMPVENKILVIQTAFIGDAILTLPMIEVIKKKNPSALIDVICIPSTYEIFSHSPFVNNAIILDKRNNDKSILGLIRFAGKLKENNYSCIYSPHRSMRSSLVVMFSGVRESFGLSNASLKFVYKNLIKYNLGDHEVLRNLKLVDNSLNEDNWKILPKITVSEEVKHKITEALKTDSVQKGFITIAPGSVWETKKYPLEHFKNVSKHLCELGYQIVLIGSEKDSEICSQIQNVNQKLIFNYAGKFSLIESIELLKNSAVLISNDSAPAHLAMCADIKTLTLYCSTIAGFGFYPFNKFSRYLSFDELDCKPCGIHGHNKCPVKTFDCGIKLLPELVIKEVTQLLN